MSETIFGQGHVMFVQLRGDEVLETGAAWPFTWGCDALSFGAVYNLNINSFSFTYKCIKCPYVHFVYPKVFVLLLFFCEFLAAFPPIFSIMKIKPNKY